MPLFCGSDRRNARSRVLDRAAGVPRPVFCGGRDRLRTRSDRPGRLPPSTCVVSLDLPIPSGSWTKAWRPIAADRLAACDVDGAMCIILMPLPHHGRGHPLRRTLTGAAPSRYGLTR